MFSVQFQLNFSLLIEGVRVGWSLESCRNKNDLVHLISVFFVPVVLKVTVVYCEGEICFFNNTVFVV